MSTWMGVAAVLGLALTTLLARCAFLLPEKKWRVPAWLANGLNHAPLAALSAVVAPQIVPMESLWTLALTPEMVGAAAGVAGYFVKRNIFMTILLGVVVMGLTSYWMG